MGLSSALRGVRGGSQLSHQTRRGRVRAGPADRRRVTWLAHRSATRSTEALADRCSARSAATPSRTRAAFVLRAAPLRRVAAVQLADNGLAVDDPDRLAPQLLAVLKANPGLSWVSYGDEQRHVHRRVPHRRKARCASTAAASSTARRSCVEHDVLPDGTLEAGPRPSDDSGYDPRKRPFYQKAKEEGRLVWLPPYVLLHSGRAGHLVRRAGQRERRIRAARCWGAHRRFRPERAVGFRRRAVGQRTFADLPVHARRGAAAHTRACACIAASGKRGEGKLLTLADAGDPLRRCVRPELPPEHVARGGAASADQAGTFHRFEFAHDGTEYLGSATPFRVGDDLVWVVGAVAPKSDFLARRVAEPGARAGRGGGGACSSRSALARAAGALRVAAGAVADRLHAARRRRRPRGEGRVRRQPRVPAARPTR